MAATMGHQFPVGQDALGVAQTSILVLIRTTSAAKFQIMKAQDRRQSVRNDHRQNHTNQVNELHLHYH